MTHFSAQPSFRNPIAAFPSAIVIAICLLGLPKRAFAVGESCISIQNDLDRLACYDDALGRTPEIHTKSASGTAWLVSSEVSQLTDETDVYMSVQSTEIIDCGWNRGQKITLWVRCVENTTALIFATQCHMTSSRYDNYGDVTYRLDEEQAQTVSMTESTNNESLGLWNGGKSIPVIKSIFGKSRLVARMTPYAENSFTASFDVAGLEEAIEPLRQACHW